MEFNRSVNPQKVYQDTRNSSPLWRQNNRIFHPLTERQFVNRFRVPHRVMMRVINDRTKIYIDGTIIRIIPYYTAEQFLGSYNIDSSFNGVPFTHVLVLQP
jgi:hypothetical protein